MNRTTTTTIHRGISKERIFFICYFIITSFVIYNLWMKSQNLLGINTSSSNQQLPFYQQLIHTPLRNDPKTSPTEPRSSPSSNLVIGLPVIPFHSENRKIVLPDNVKRVWFDVGSHKNALNTRPSLDTQSDLVVIAFEPLYDQWGHLTIKNRHPRLFTIPAAVSTVQGNEQVHSKIS